MTKATPSIVWSDIYSVHVSEIDAQHKVLLTILNALNQAVAEALSERRVRHLLWTKLDELNEYAAFHFMTEEKLMHDHLPADADMARHISQHRQYWVSINDFKERGRHDEVSVLPLLTSFLNSWWIGHIQSTDVQLGKALIAKGVS